MFGYALTGSLDWFLLVSGVMLFLVVTEPWLHVLNSMVIIVEDLIRK